MPRVYIEGVFSMLVCVENERPIPQKCLCPINFHPKPDNSPVL